MSDALLTHHTSIIISRGRQRLTIFFNFSKNKDPTKGRKLGLQWQVFVTFFQEYVRVQYHIKNSQERLFTAQFLEDHHFSPSAVTGTAKNTLVMTPKIAHGATAKLFLLLCSCFSAEGLFKTWMLISQTPHFGSKMLLSQIGMSDIITLNYLLMIRQ